MILRGVSLYRSSNEIIISPKNHKYEVICKFLLKLLKDKMILTNFEYEKESGISFLRLAEHIFESESMKLGLSAARHYIDIGRKFLDVNYNVHTLLLQNINLKSTPKLQ